MKKKRLIILALVVVVVVSALLFPGSSLQRRGDIKRIAEDLSSVTSRINKIESELSGSSPKAGTLENGIEDFRNEVMEFSEKVMRFQDRHSNTYIDEFLKAFVREFYRFDELFVSGIVPIIQGVPELKAEEKPPSEKQTSIKFVVGSFNFPSYFRSVLEQEGYIYREFRLAETIDEIKEEALASKENSLTREAAEQLSKLKEDFLLFYAGKLQGASTTTIDKIESYTVNTPGDPVRRLALLDEVRENVLDSEIKTRLNIIRQKLLLETGEKIDRQTAEDALIEAEGTIQNLKDEISAREGGVSRLVNQSLERAEFHLKQARAFEEKRNYGSAFGQGTAALVAARSVLLPFAVNIDEYRDDIEFLRQHFDYLVALMDGSLNVSDTIQMLIDESESEILKVSRLLETDTESNRTFTALKNLKVLMGTLDQTVKESLRVITAESQ